MRDTAAGFAGARALTARFVMSRGKPPLHSAFTQSSHSAIASRGLNVTGLKLNSTHRPSSSADRAMAAGRSLNGGAAPECDELTE